MTKEWRPDNWDKVKPDVTIISEKLGVLGAVTTTPNEMFRVGAEAGAGAMLKAAKEAICKRCLRDLSGRCTKENCWIVGAIGGVEDV